MNRVKGEKMAQEKNRKKAKSGKLMLLAEFWQFMRVRKKIWLAPIIIVLLLLALIVVFTEGTAIAPFIYALF